MRYNLNAIDETPKPQEKIEVTVNTANVTNIHENYILAPAPSDLLGENRGCSVDGEVGYEATEINVSSDEHLLIKSSEFIGLEQNLGGYKNIKIINNGIQKINIGGSEAGGVFVNQHGDNRNQPSYQIGLDYSSIRDKIGGVQTVSFNNSDYTPDVNGNVSITYVGPNANTESPKKTISITSNSASTKYFEVAPLRVNNNSINISSVAGGVGSLVNFTDTQDIKFVLDPTNGDNKLSITAPKFVKAIKDSNGNDVPIVNGVATFPIFSVAQSFYGEISLSSAQVGNLFNSSQGINIPQLPSVVGTKPSAISNSDTVILYYGVAPTYNLVPPSSIVNNNGVVYISSGVTSIASNSKLIWHIVKN